MALLLAFTACNIQPAPAPIPTVVRSTPVPSPTKLPLLPTITLQPSPEAWVERWLQGIPCQPPCWEGITPGGTTAEEAVEVLEVNPIFQSVEDVGTGWFPASDGSIKWEGESGESGGLAVYDTSTNIVHFIRSYTGNHFTFGQVIDAYGEPSHIITWDSCLDYEGGDRFYGADFAYRSHSFIITAIGGTNKPVLNRDMQMNGVVFLNLEEDNDLVLEDEVRVPSNLVVWDGFKDFHEYSDTPEEMSCP